MSVRETRHVAAAAARPEARGLSANLGTEALWDGWTTPIQRLGTFCGDNEIYMKRDDLLPFSFGGNKARIARRFFDDAIRRGAGCVVAYGSSRSNLVRVMANGAASIGMPCYVVSPEERDGGRPESFNSGLATLLGARVRRCGRAQVAQAVEDVMDEARAAGLEPYYIYGGSDGTGNEAVPVGAYVDAWGEVESWEESHGVHFDIVAHASGTGMTQAGLACGAALSGSRAIVLGISVARDSGAGMAHVLRYAGAYLESVGLGGVDVRGRLVFEDGYRCGGYGLADSGVLRTMRGLFVGEGIASDPTYVGKGLSGTLRWLEGNGVRGARVLFVHTGGTPLFFDHLNGLINREEGGRWTL